VGPPQLNLDVSGVRPDVLRQIGKKVLDAKAKHRWLEACARYRGFVDSPGVLRLAILLFKFYNPELGFAFPSRRTLSERLGSPPASVSRWLRPLKSCGAVKVVKAKDVPVEVREATRRTSKRANYYQLDFDWAETVLEGKIEIDWDAEMLDRE